MQASLLVQLAVHAGPHLEAARLEARLHVHHPLDHAPAPQHNSEGYTVKKRLLIFPSPAGMSLNKLSMTKIAGSGAISQRHGSADPDPDPDQNVMDSQHCFQITQPGGGTTLVQLCTGTIEAAKV